MARTRGRRPRAPSPANFSRRLAAQGVDNKSARSGCEDENGVMWFGTGGKQVVRWDQGEFSVLTPADPAPFGEIKIWPAGAGKLWVGTVQNGLLKLVDGKFHRPFPAQAIGTVVQAIEIGIADGSIRTDIGDPLLFAMTLWAFTHGIIQLAMAKASELARRGIATPQFADYAFDLLSGMIRNQRIIQSRYRRVIGNFIVLHLSKLPADRKCAPH